MIKTFSEIKGDISKLLDEIKQGELHENLSRLKDDISDLRKSVCFVIEKIALISEGPVRGGMILLGAIKRLEEEKKKEDTENRGFIAKRDIMKCLKYDIEAKDYSKIDGGFNYLKKNHFINAKRASEKFIMVTLNEERHPELKLLKDIVEDWDCPLIGGTNTEKWGAQK